MSGSHPHNFSPSRALSPQIRTTHETDSQYLAALLAEFQKLGPFRQVLPICTHLLNQEIFRVTGTSPHQVLSNLDVMQMQHGSPSASPMISPDILPRTLPWSNQLYEQLFGSPVGMNTDWLPAPMSPNSYMVKKILRLEIPVDRYPNFNFVGRLLGPRGNSLKRVEASTGCRIYIRGKGSIKDPEKEESLRGRPGYEHLTEPLHILIEAEFTANVVDIQLRQAQEIIQELLKPVDESYDIYKRQQLKELAMLNSGLREENPFSSNVMRLTETDKKYDAVESAQ